ncbi:ATP-binding protein [Pseudanabaena sp. FACHB-1998]|uniref:helix-turn-helix domain-containing protein n=1 Tax=Pseudanabaena sp. FACHB-1998 TaxID=2692858 RepID=UPI001680C282|nr:helix-turn-helix domain-containing protein [Pseudanabaena sp. FACHB-1998]MBD2177027.1 ATP-binding protein [Pseudanabaena sp. FACHB-1998]
MINNPFLPQRLVGRHKELEQISQILLADGDLLIAGVAGSGRRTLVKWAAKKVGARVITLDCLRATDGDRFLKLVAEGLLNAFDRPDEILMLQQMLKEQQVNFELEPKPYIKWKLASSGIWSLFQYLLRLPQQMAEWLDCRVAIVLHNFTHIRSWDRKGEWEEYLRREIQLQSRVSYTLIATVPEPWMHKLSIDVVELPPLHHEELYEWLEPTMENKGLRFDPNNSECIYPFSNHATSSLQLFKEYIQGNLSDAIALIRRIWLDSLTKSNQSSSPSIFLIQPHHVHHNMLALIEDLAPTFESLIMLLPPTQVRVLESLAIDPTVSPHSREYIQKHQLSKGGSLQGALDSLEQKGLVYGAKYGYRIALPTLQFWLKQRLG